MNKSIVTSLVLSLAACISQAYATTTDLTLKSAPNYKTPPEFESVEIKSNKGTFYWQWRALSDADNLVLKKAKKGQCLSIRTEGALTESSIQSVTNCKKASAVSASTTLTYSFTDYPTELYAGPKRIPITGEFKDMRSNLIRMAKQKVDFAGRYVVGGWGCGTGCYVPVLLNVQAGQAQKIDQLEELDGLDTSVDCSNGLKAGIDTRANSHLLIRIGGKHPGLYDGEPIACSQKYYIEKDGKLSPLK